MHVGGQGLTPGILCTLIYNSVEGSPRQYGDDGMRGMLPRLSHQVPPSNGSVRFVISHLRIPSHRTSGKDVCVCECLLFRTRDQPAGVDSWPSHPCRAACLCAVCRYQHGYASHYKDRPSVLRRRYDLKFRVRQPGLPAPPPQLLMCAG